MKLEPRQLFLFVEVLLLFMMKSSGFIPSNSLSKILGKGMTHSNITKQGVLRWICRMFQETPNFKGITLPPESCQVKVLSAEVLIDQYYGGAVPPVGLVDALDIIASYNVLVDLQNYFNEQFHFDAELFDESKALVLNGIERTSLKLKENDPQSARSELGTLLHIVQDFYSHSNYLELGHREPNPGITSPDIKIGNVAGPTQRTCVDCDETCENNIPPQIIENNILTTGYFMAVPYIPFISTSQKPKGKCSHGGSTDFGSYDEPVGGINKDMETSSHGYLHYEAAEVAVKATTEVLEIIKDKVGVQRMARLLNLGAGGVWSCVVDTREVSTGDLAAKKQNVFSIVGSKKGTLTEPSTYVLVPFNSTGFGPVFQTKDADIFKTKVANLKPEAGGQDPGMCLSALGLSLESTPQFSSIYVFTAASAKDIDRKNYVTDLIERKKTSVNFVIANPLARRKRGLLELLLSPPSPRKPDLPIISSNPDYKDITSFSGGELLSVPPLLTKPLASLIADQTQRSKVLVFYARSSPSKSDYAFSFEMDPALQEVRLSLSGVVQALSVIDPNGLLNTIPIGGSGLLGGLLATVENILQVGETLVVSLLQTLTGGEWKLKILSLDDFTVKVEGHSAMTFRYQFQESFDGPHPGFVGIDHPLTAGSEAVMTLSVTGLTTYDSYNFHSISLIDLEGNELQALELHPLSQPGDYWAELKAAPSQPFTVVLRGVDTVTNHVFQRQSSITHRPSNITVKGFRGFPLPPGCKADIPFTIQNIGQTSTYIINVAGSSIVESYSPSRVKLERGESTEGQVTVAIPDTAESGTSSTIEIQVVEEDLHDHTTWFMECLIQFPSK
ncbi:von Willebrand factor A domain-containing protein 7-like [Lissotriton helveticus]